MDITAKEQTDKNSEAQEEKNSLKDALKNYAEYHNPKEMARLFEKYMRGIGAGKQDRRRKDTANTYRITAAGEDRAGIECCYYKNSGDWRGYKKFTFRIQFSSPPAGSFLIEAGNTDAGIKRLYETASGTVLYYDKKSLLKLVRQHPELFVMLCEKEG